MGKRFGIRRRSTILVLLLLLGTLFVVPVGTVSAAQDGDYTYTVSDGNATITGYTGSGGTIAIPDTLDHGSLVVVAIGDYTFSNKLSLTSVRIPFSVKSIGEEAFSCCFSLTSVTIGRSVTAIGSWAFYKCTSLTSITFLGLDSPAVCNDWIAKTPVEIRGHAYAPSNFPTPGHYFYGLMMGEVIPAIVPDAPTGLIAIPGYSQATLNWTAPSSNRGSAITNYTVYRGLTSGGEAYLTTLGNVLIYNDTGLSNGQTYYYKVRAMNDAGEGNMSNEASATPSVRPPTAPQNLQANPGDAYINLTWQAPASDGGSAITNYEVWRGTSSGAETFLTDAGLNLWFNDTGLSNGQTYYYKVSANNSIGEGPKSTEASALPVTVPAAPTLSSVTPGNEQVILVWTAPSDGGATINNYTVYRGTTPGGETYIITLGNVLTYTNNGLTNGQVYYYKVSANNSIGEGVKSNEASAIPVNVPSAPRGMQALAGDSYVHLNWTAPSFTGPGTLTYHLFRNDISIWNGNGITYTDITVLNGVTYSYKVSANNSVGWGLNCTAIQAMPQHDVKKPTAPRNLIAIPGNENVTLSWEAPAYSNASTISGYMISYGTSTSSMPNHITWNQLVYVLEGLTKGAKYYFSVAAQNSAGWGPNCTAESATPFGVPSAPRGLTTTIGDQYVILNWTAPQYTGPGTLVYHLFRDGLQIWNEIGLTYADTNVTNAIEYSYKVAANNSVGWGLNCTEVQASPQSGNTVPTAPRGLSAAPGNLFIDLNWIVPSYSGPGTLTYHLFRNGTLIWSGTAIVYHDTSLMKGVQYSYEVAANNSLGWGANCTAVLATPIGVPDAPWDLNAVPGNTQVSLSWNAVNYSGPGTLNYHLFRDGVEVWNGTVISYDDNGLSNGQTYVYKVAANNSVGWGPNSSSLQATPTAFVPVPPGAPTNFYVIAGDGLVSLSWSPPASNGSAALSGYKIYRGTNSSSMTLLNMTTATIYTDAGLTNGQKYYYKLCAYSSAGNSTMSDTLDATPNSEGGGTDGGGVDNTMLYLVIVAIAIVAVAGAVIAMMRKRKS